MTPDRASCPSRHKHGTNNAYRNHGCRCPDAREDYRLYEKRRREGRLTPAYIPAHGVTRRLQALAALGWSINDLAPRLGVSPQRVHELRAARWATVHRSTADAVTRTYEQLSGTPGPGRATRTAATRNGWAPPLLWPDDTIDDPHAEPIRDTPAARTRVDLDDVDHLTAQGLRLEEIAARLGVQPASIERARYRAAARSPNTVSEVA